MSQRFPAPSVRGFSTPNVPLCGPTFQTGMWRYPLVMPQLPLHPLVEGEKFLLFSGFKLSRLFCSPAHASTDRDTCVIQTMFVCTCICTYVYTQLLCLVCTCHIRESVDSLCRDGSGPPIVCVHWKAVLTRERSCSKPFWTPSYPIRMFLYSMIPPK